MAETDEFNGSCASFWCKAWPYFALAALTLCIFFADLGGPGMYAPQEGRAGIIVRNMVDSGDYLSIQFKGHDTTEKPIFFYWLCLLSCKVFGFNEFAVRFPAAASACLGVLLAYLLGRRIYGERTGLLAGFILATSLSFVNFGRIARIDIVLGVAYAWTMYLLYLGYFEKLKANWRLYLFYFMLGICVLIKGPVAVALAGLGVVLFSLVQRDWRIYWELKPLSGLIIGLAVTCPWFIYEGSKTGGEYTTKFLFSHNVERYLGIAGTYGGGKRKSVFFYIPNLLAGAMPWTIFLPSAILKLWSCLRSLRPQTWFLLCWFASVFIFFSFSAYKRTDYLMPLYPALAILASRLIVRLQEEGKKLSRLWLWGWGFLAAAALAFLILVKYGVASHIATLCIDKRIPGVSGRDAKTALQAFTLIDGNLAWAFLGGLAALGIVFICCKLFEHGKIIKGTGVIASLAFAFHMVFNIFLAPGIDSLKTLKNESLAFEKTVPKNAPVMYFDVDNAEELIFYIPREYEEADDKGKLFNPDGSFRYRFIVFREDKYEALSTEQKMRLEVLGRTAPKHQYPSVFCRVKGN